MSPRPAESVAAPERPGRAAVDRPAPGRPSSGREAFRAALAEQARRSAAGGGAAEPSAARRPLVDDTVVSADDESIDDLGTVGQPVIAEVLGGVVIREIEA